MSKLDAIRKDLDAVLRRLAKYVDAFEGLIHEEAAPPAPVPTLPPRAPESPFVEVLATYWSGVKPGDNDRMLFALPAPTYPDETMDVALATRPNDLVRGLSRGDTGPWSTRDPYFRPPTHRPAAEAFTGLPVRWDKPSGMWTPTGDGPKTLTCNGAGVDLTRAVWCALLGIGPDEVDRQQPSMRVRFRLVRPATVAIVHPSIEAAALALVGHPFPYDPGTDGGNLGCADVVSHALLSAGALTGPPILSVDALVARLEGDGWRRIPAVAFAPGDVIVWAATATSGGHQHVGIAVGDGTEAVENSSRDLAVERIRLVDYARPIRFGLRKAA